MIKSASLDIGQLSLQLPAQLGHRVKPISKLLTEQLLQLSISNSKTIKQLSLHDVQIQLSASNSQIAGAIAASVQKAIEQQ